MNTIKITNHQLLILTSGFMFGTSPLIIATAVTSVAKEDAWLSVLLTTAVGLVFVWIYAKLGALYPEKDLVEIIREVFGKGLGTIIALFFVFIALNTTTQVAWYVGDFITSVYMPEVPSLPTNIFFIAIVSITMFYGLEAMCRATEILFNLLFPLYIISMLLLIPDVKINNLLPVMENGVLPVFKGIVPLLSLTVMPLVFLTMIYPANFSDIKGAKKSLYKGYYLGMLTTGISVIMCLLVLGSTLTINLRFPLFWITKEINVGMLLSRVEAVILFIWLGTKFISAFFFFYAGVKGLSQILKLNDYKRIVLPLALIIVVYSDSIYKNVPYQIRWDSQVWPPVVFTVGFVLPVLLLLVSAIRKRKGKKQAS